MPTLVSRCSKPMIILLAISIAAQSQQKAAAPKSEDIHIKKSITVGGCTWITLLTSGRLLYIQVWMKTSFGTARSSRPLQHPQTDTGATGDRH